MHHDYYLHFVFYEMYIFSPNFDIYCKRVEGRKADLRIFRKFMEKERNKTLLNKANMYLLGTGVSSLGVSFLGVPGVPWHPQILADKLTLSQPGGTYCALYITTFPSSFSSFINCFVIVKPTTSRDVGDGWAGWAIAHPGFGR